MTMPTREIIRDQWVTFFETFTADHVDRLVSLAVNGKLPEHDIVDVEARILPLREIAADLKDRVNTIVISLGLSRDKLLRHAIQSVSHVRVTRTEDGSASALAIESMNGQTTTLNIDEPVSSKS